MRKLAVVILSAVAFAACSSDDESPGLRQIDGPALVETTTTGPLVSAGGP